MKNPIALRFFLFCVIIFLFTSKINATYASSPWTQLGLADRRVESLVNDPTNPNILYAGTDNGVYKSNNGGNNWIIQSNQGISASVVVIASSNPNILYATKGGSGIQKSTNAGNTWVDVTSNLGPAIGILDLAIDPTDSNIVYVAMYGQCGGVWKTINGGTTWNSVSSGCDFYRVAIAPSNHNIIYAGSLNLTGYFIKSVNGGNTWTNPGNQGLGSVGAVRGIAIDPNNPSIIYAGTEISGIFKSIDSAASWTFLSNSPSTAVASALTINPTNNTIYSRSSTGVSESIDGGATWTSMNSGQTPPPAEILRLVVFSNNSHNLYATTSTGIYVYELTDNQPSILNVPYFSQNDLPWGPTEYDHSIKLGFTNPTMDRWGCAVTSAAMVLKFHNINQFTDGTTIDPGSLNNWLKNNNGYLTGKGSGGSYSYFNWPVIGKLTKQLFDVNKSDTKLMYKRAYPNNNTTYILNEDLNKFPDILKVSNSQTSNHFVVAKGKSSNTYSINDPEWNHPTLASFNDSYTQVDRYIPSNTNLSYIVLVVNPSTEILVTDSQGRRSGKYVGNGQVNTFNNIPDVSYSFQPPINNSNDQNVLEELGTGVNEFLLPEPENGDYEIKLSSPSNTIYEINISTFQENGSDELNKIKGVLSNNNDETLIINYSQTENSHVDKIVTFENLINDLNELKKLNQIKNDGIYNSLLVKGTIAQLSSLINKKASTNILKAMLNEIKAQRGKGITEDAYQILFYDINYLINNL